MDSNLNSLRKLFAQAAVYNFNTPGRSGETVYLNEFNASDIIITGDLHGHRRNFYDICDLADLGNNPQRHLVLQEVCHGGGVYSDGSCASHQVVEDVARLVCQYPGRVHFILGNHELAEMINFPIRKHGRLLNLDFAQGLVFRYGAAQAHSVHDWMARWFWSCPLAVRWRQKVFCTHSIPSECNLNPPFDFSIFDRSLTELDFNRDGAFYRLVWGRDYREDNAKVFAEKLGVETLITGHDPCLGAGFKQPNSLQFILDCCDDTPAFIHLTSDMNLDPQTVRSAIHFL